MAKIPDARKYGPAGHAKAVRPRDEIYEQAEDISEINGDSLFSLFTSVADMEARGGRVVRMKPDGSIEVVSVERGSSGFSIFTMTYNSCEDYQYKERILATL